MCSNQIIPNQFKACLFHAIIFQRESVKAFIKALDNGLVSEEDMQMIEQSECFDDIVYLADQSGPSKFLFRSFMAQSDSTLLVPYASPDQDSLDKSKIDYETDIACFDDFPPLTPSNTEEEVDMDEDTDTPVADAIQDDLVQGDALNSLHEDSSCVTPVANAIQDDLVQGDALNSLHEDSSSVSPVADAMDVDAIDFDAMDVDGGMSEPEMQVALIEKFGMSSFIVLTGLKLDGTDSFLHNISADTLNLITSAVANAHSDVDQSVALWLSDMKSLSLASEATGSSYPPSSSSGNGKLIVLRLISRSFVIEFILFTTVVRRKH
jgi:hypothetical protein